MTERTLVPLDGSDESYRAIDHAARMIRRTAGRGRLHLLRVVPPFDPTRAERDEHARGADALRLRVNAAQRHLDDRVAQLRSRGVDAASLVRVGEPETTLPEAISELKPTLIAMTTHGRRGPSRWVQGSVAEGILRASKVPILLVNVPQTDAPPMLPYRKVLLPLDGTPTSEAAVALLEQLAPRPRPHVVLCRFARLPVYVSPGGMIPAPIVAHDTSHLQAALEPVAERLIGNGYSISRRVAFGDPTELILTTMGQEEVDLTVMATHGASGLERLLYGSVTESVLRRSTTPLLVTRTGARLGA